MSLSDFIIWVPRNRTRSIAGQQILTEDDPSFALSFIFEGEYVLSSTSSADVDYVQIPQPHDTMAPPQFRAIPRHFYGLASMPLHVDGDMDSVTISVPEPTPKEDQMYRDAIRQQEQQNHPAATQQ